MNTLIILAIAIVALCAAWLAWKRSRIKLAAAILCGFVGLALLLYVASRISQPLRCEFGDPVDLPKQTHPAGYVYVIQDLEFSKYHKIGRAIEPAKRINEIRRVLPGESEIVAIIDSQNAPTLEGQLHQRYAASRKRGEWFELNHSDIREICEI